MLEALLAGAARLADPAVIGAMLLALPVGIVVGLLPGLTGIAAFSFLIPLTFGASPVAGLAFLLAAYAAVSQGGAITAIVLGIPGEVPNAATVLDGHAMARAGRGGEAIGAALAASAVGAVFSGLLLLALLPVAQPILLSFASPEIFCLALAGIAFIAVLSTGAPLKGLISGLLGIFLALFGYAPTEGVPRFWMGIDYLLDGFRLAPLAMGLFAVPEIVRLTGAAAPAAAGGEPPSLRQTARGARAVLRHWKLCLRSSAIGAFVGLMPGAGATTATFVAYAAAKRTDADPASFGKGRIDGVIAPEASSNAKEGGALLATLALGIPGSAAMALLLAAFVGHGLQPGPEFLARHLDLAVALALILTLGNIASSALAFLLARPLIRINRIPGAVLAPAVAVLVASGAYAAENNPIDILFVFVFGLLGLAMERQGYNRAALLLGFVLGETMERYFQISVSAYGGLFFLRPISLTILAVTAALLFWPNWNTPRAAAGRAAHAESALPMLILAGVATLLATGHFVLGYSWTSFAFPFGVGLPLAALCGVQLAAIARQRQAPAPPAGADAAPFAGALAGLLALGGLIYGLGFIAGPTAYLVAALRADRQPWRLILAMALGSMALGWGLFVRLLGVPLPLKPLWWP